MDHYAERTMNPKAILMREILQIAKEISKEEKGLKKSKKVTYNNRFLVCNVLDHKHLFE